MSATEWMVVLGGVAAIALVNWYFLFADRGRRPRDESRGRNER